MRFVPLRWGVRKYLFGQGGSLTSNGCNSVDAAALQNQNLQAGLDLGSDVAFANSLGLVGI